jgi:4-diphosphocytidyl-2-C-methyl-D-erythritol kinase
MRLRALYDLAAPAKLNLFLHVVGRRADGYHLLQSAFVLIDWADTLHIELRDDGQVTRSDRGTGLPADDLAVRAARALRSASGCAPGAHITVEKSIPIGAGMGGGSSDAATVLLALNRLWRLRWPRGRLIELAATLGADVPFFVGGENAWVEGAGERLTTLPWPPAWYAVIKPAVSTSTREVFERFRQQAGAAEQGSAAILSGSLADALARLRAGEEGGQGFGANQLEPIAAALHPEVTAALEWLRHRFGNARMTGSGSAVFARAGMGDHPVATLPAAELPSGWVGRMCRSLSRHPLVRWAG